METLYTPEEFEKAPSRSALPLRCAGCHNTFYKTKHQIQKALHPGAKDKSEYCSIACCGLHRDPRISLHCSNCGKVIRKSRCQMGKGPNHFCSQSCSATYNNTHKTKGIRRSKLEAWIEKELSPRYMGLDIQFNKKDTINSELDIYIPTLKLAFEISGIFHYKPIYEQKRFSEILANDAKKRELCRSLGIRLYVINSSKMMVFKVASGNKYLAEITEIIDFWKRIREHNPRYLSAAPRQVSGALPLG